MKTNHIIKNLAALALVSAFSLQPSALLGQGSLTPPGSPAPTMKSADQIYSKLDPRTPISSAPFTISTSGSYYLTTNLTVSGGDGIDINTNGVTLDLNGFTISSAATSVTGSGILLNSGLSDITIINGHIRSGVTNNGSGVYSGNGFAYGIAYYMNSSANVIISKVSIMGVKIAGIILVNSVYNTNATVVEDCTVTTSGGLGICASTIKGSVATDCGSYAIYGEQVIDCRGISTGDAGVGVLALTAQNSRGYNTSSGTGLSCSEVAIGCYGFSSSGCGLSANIANSCIIGSGTTSIIYHYNMPPP